MTTTEIKLILLGYVWESKGSELLGGFMNIVFIAFLGEIFFLTLTFFLFQTIGNILIPVADGSRSFFIFMLLSVRAKRMGNIFILLL